MHGDAAELHVGTDVLPSTTKASLGTAIKYVSLYKILFRFKALLWVSIILVSPYPTCKVDPIAVLLHDHRAIYALLPTPRLYAVNYTIVVMAISCTGQAATRYIHVRMYVCMHR